MAEKRKSPRVPILTQVEAQGTGLSLTALGRASDISVGGLLVETPDTVAPGTTAIVRFFLPPKRQPVEAVGQVVRTEPGKAMAIAFLDLPESQQHSILQYIESIRGTPTEKLLLEPRQGWPRARRGGRLARRLAAVLTWQDEQGRPQQQAAETQLLSQHGALVQLFGELKRAQLVRLRLPDLGQEATTRVIWAAAAELPGRLQAGLELVGGENFWGLEFPPDQIAFLEGTAPSSRRRSGRLPRRIDVVLNWADESGQGREGYGQTLTLSRFGAAISSLAALPEKHRFRLRAPEMNRETEARVVWAKPSTVAERTDLGVEFLETIDFWGMPFPPDPGSTSN